MEWIGILIVMTVKPKHFSLQCNDKYILIKGWNKAISRYLKSEINFKIDRMHCEILFLRLFLSPWPVKNVAFRKWLDGVSVCLMLRVLNRAEWVTTSILYNSYLLEFSRQDKYWLLRLLTKSIRSLHWTFYLKSKMANYMMRILPKIIKVNSCTYFTSIEQ